jgi:hypothetical protein
MKGLRRKHFPRAGGTVAILHRLRAEVHFFVFAKMAVARAQVFTRSAP